MKYDGRGKPAAPIVFGLRLHWVKFQLRPTQMRDERGIATSFEMQPFVLATATGFRLRNPLLFGASQEPPKHVFTRLLTPAPSVICIPSLKPRKSGSATMSPRFGQATPSASTFACARATRKDSRLLRVCASPSAAPELARRSPCERSPTASASSAFSPYTAR